MARPSSSRLLSFARELQRAATFEDLLEIARSEVQRETGYLHVWLFVSETETVEEMRLLGAAGGLRQPIWAEAPLLTVKGDPMLEEIVRSDEPVVVEDARIDPRTDKKIVGRLGNRTIINVPLRLLDKPFGALGIGTFEAEGCRPPTREQLDYLVGMAGQLVVAAGRIRFLEERERAARERSELERQLAQAHRLESLGALAGGIAHDFNNLLAVIVTSGTLLRRGAVEPRAIEDADAIIDAAQRGRAMTRQLLAMSRSQPLRLERVDAGERLRQLITLLRRLVPGNIALELAIEPGLPAVLADGAQLDQVFMNLVINARDAMAKGGTVTIEAAQVELDAAATPVEPGPREGRYVLTTVRDNGCGMPPEVVERIFEPFYTTRREAGGTGLGLAVAYGIVGQHRGMLQCRSEVGVGTTFKVYMPIAPAA